MNRFFQIMGLIVCCAAIPAKALDEEASRPGQAVEVLPPGKQPEIELPVQPTNALAKAAVPEPDPLSPLPRDPLWPVGYVPPVEKKADEPATASQPDTVGQLEPPQWDVAIKTLVIKGIMKSGASYMAVINGQVTSENDTISTNFKGRTYSWRIAKISQKGVQFERLEPAQ
jgi:hypothetical protein